MGSQNTARRVWGPWSVIDEVPLPELPLAPLEQAGAPAILVREAAVPAPGADWQQITPLVHRAPDGTLRFEVPDIAAFLVSGDGWTVSVAPASGAEAGDVRLFLYGTVQALLAVAHGLLPLHAATMAKDGRALAISGASGAGKSTLAAALSHAGWHLVADDVTLVGASPAGPLQVSPGVPRVKLWRDMVEGFGLTTDGLARTRMELEKFQLLPAHGMAAGPVPLAALVLLEAPPPGPLGTPPPPLTLTRLRGQEAFLGVESAVYRRRLVGALMPAKQRLAALGGLASRAAVHRLVRVQSLAALPEVLAALEGVLACNPVGAAGAAQP
ncbi:MAG: hypothetical protein EAZ99_17105 [Alphaproteobacteria bacterium]|nr:MAG: hypothetical protein EAZ99_17105 [Alphaproteobacteria bacterium]